MKVIRMEIIKIYYDGRWRYREGCMEPDKLETVDSLLATPNGIARKKDTAHLSVNHFSFLRLPPFRSCITINTFALTYIISTRQNTREIILIQ